MDELLGLIVSIIAAVAFYMVLHKMIEPAYITEIANKYPKAHKEYHELLKEIDEIDKEISQMSKTIVNDQKELSQILKRNTNKER